MSKLDLSKLEDIQSPEELDKHIIGTASNRLQDKQLKPRKSTKLMLAISYCCGVLTLAGMNYFEGSSTPYPTRVYAEDIDLSSLSVSTRGNNQKWANPNLDDMSIEKLKDIHFLLIQRDEWEEAKKMSLYIQQRQRRNAN